MKDKFTGQRVIVHTDAMHGPFISLRDYEQFDQLDDVLSENHYVLYDVRTLSAPDTEEKLYQMPFGMVADQGKIQKLLDGIDT